MAQPEAELVITPELARGALMDMQRKFNKAFTDIANETEKQMAGAIEDGVEDGVKKSGKGFRSLFSKSNISKGAKIVGGSIAGIAIAGYVNAIERFESSRDLIGGLAADSTAQRSLNTARAAGFTDEQFGQLLAQFRGAGFTDDTAITDVIQDITERVQESQVGGSQILSQFAQYSGQERINRVLAAVSQEDGEQQIQTLAEIGISGEDANNILNLLETASDGGERSGTETLEFLNTSQLSAGEQVAISLRDEAAFVKEFREREREANAEFRKQVLANLNTDDINTYFDARKVTEDKQIRALGDFQTTAKAAIEAQTAIDTVMKGLEDTMNLLTETIVSVKNALENSGFFDTQTEEEKQIEKEQRAKASLEFRAMLDDFFSGRW